LEVGQASTFGIIIAISKGFPFTVIGNLSDVDAANPNIALIVSADSPIRTAKDLEGKTIASTTLQDSNTIATLLWLQQRGVDTSTLKAVEVPAAASLAALEQNRITAATIYEPFYSAFQSTGKIRVLGFPYEAIGKHFSSSLIVADPKWVAAKRDTLNRFLQATDESATYVAAHESETSVVSARFLGIEPAQMKSVRHPIRGTAISASEIQPLIDVALKFKVIPRMLAPDEIICSCAFRK
jgi:NitT/TauT family transport system substrate-binding protein